MEATAGLLLRRGRALAVRRPPEGLLGGMWELPGGDLAAKESPGAGWKRALREHCGLSVARVRRVGEVEHAFTHRLLRLHVYRAELADDAGGRVRLDGPDAHRWLAPDRLRALPQGTATRKALALVLGPS